MSNIVLFIAAYFVVLAVLSVAVRPNRLRLKQIANELLNEKTTDSEREMITRLAGSAYSIRTAPMLLLVFTMGVLRRSQELDGESDKWAVDHPILASDRRSFELLDLHMASAAAVNPIFGSLAYLAKWIFRAKAKAHFRRANNGERRVDIYEMRVVSA